MQKLILVLYLSLLVTFTAKSQLSIMDDEYTHNCFIGITGGIGLTSYSGLFVLFGDRVDCEPYTFKSKSGFNSNVLFGLRTELRISKKFDVYALLLYEERTAKFEPIDYSGPVSQGIDKPMDAPLETLYLKQILDIKNINIFSISPMVKYKPFDFDFGILFGPSCAFMVSDDIYSEEFILSPEDFYFKETGKRERDIYSGEIESKNALVIDLKFGLSYGIMLTEKIKLSPEIFYAYPLMNTASEDDWKISSIQFLLNLSYGF